MRKYLTYAMFALALVGGGAVRADLALTEANITGFIDSLGALEDVGKDIEYDMGNLNLFDGEVASVITAPFSNTLNILRGHESYGRFLEVIKQYGFEDAEVWAHIGDRVIRAYVALNLQAQQREIDTNMAQALLQIENSDMPEAQKEQMRQVMISTLKTYKVFAEVPEEDIAQIQPYRQKLDEYTRRFSNQP